MSCKSKHDKISICSIKTMTHVRIISRGSSLTSNVIKEFMLSFSRDTCITENDLQTFPKRVVLESVKDIVLKAFGHSGHEFCSWSNDVFIKVDCVFIIFSKLKSFLNVFSLQLFLSDILFLDFLGSSKSSSSLLVHFSSWSNTIDSKIDQSFRSKNFDELIYIFKNIVKHLCLRCRLFTF